VNNLLSPHAGYGTWICNTRKVQRVVKFVAGLRYATTRIHNVRALMSKTDGKRRKLLVLKN